MENKEVLVDFFKESFNFSTYIYTHRAYNNNKSTLKISS